MIYVSLVEDDDDIREGFALLIGGTPGFNCVAAYPDAEAALHDLPNNPPDVLLLDIELPGMSGIDALQQIKSKFPEVDVIMLTIHEEDQMIFSSLCAGACGYLVKNTPPAKLLSAIEEVTRGGAPMSAHIARRVIRSFNAAKPSGLTERETDILKQLCAGKSYKMIAAELGITRGTVHCHIKNIYKKLQVHSNSEAVAKAMRERLI